MYNIANEFLFLGVKYIKILNIFSISIKKSRNIEQFEFFLSILQNRGEQ